MNFSRRPDYASVPRQVRSNTRRWLLPLLLCAALAGGAIEPAVATATPPTGQLSQAATPKAATPQASTPKAATPQAAAAAAVVPVTGPAGQDYATNTFADPWDYSNADDMILNFSGTQRTTALSMSNGGIRAHLTGNSAYLSPIWAGYSRSLLTGRDGALAANAVDAGKYNAMTFEAYSNAARGTNFYIVWFNCPGIDPAPACSGRSALIYLMPGWNTYVVPLGATGGSGGSFPKNWSGRINGLRIVFNAGVSDFKMDYARLYQRNSGLGLNVPGLSGGDLVWDRNTSAADNVQEPGWATSGTTSPNWGVLRREASARAQVVSGSRADLSFLPPGTYRIGVQAGKGAPVKWTNDVTLDSPRPELLTPNAVGAVDYATAVRHDPWDMAQSTDIAGLANARATFSGGMLRGVNSGPKFNDPFVTLRQGATPIAGSTYHILTITTSFSGAYSVGGSPGGGTVGRLIWQRADHATVTQSVTSRDIITYPGVRTITIDLSRPGNEVIAGFLKSPSWAFSDKSPIVSLRWDPNEDPANGSNGAAARQWQILDVQLRSDFTADAVLPVTWIDRDYQPGGVATLRVGTTQNACSGTAFASSTQVQAGVNTTLLKTSTLPNGRYWICLQITRHGATVTNLARGVVVVSHSAHRVAAPAAPAAAPRATRNGGRVDLLPGAGRREQQHDRAAGHRPDDLHQVPHRQPAGPGAGPGLRAGWHLRLVRAVRGGGLLNHRPRCGARRRPGTGPAAGRRRQPMPSCTVQEWMKSRGSFAVRSSRRPSAR